MKYYICIERPSYITIDENNEFINNVFYSNYKPSRHIFGLNINQNYYNEPLIHIVGLNSNQDYANVSYCFVKGGIYHTSPLSDELILDAINNEYLLSNMRQFFKEFTFELDDETKQIIDVKSKKGDIIQIKPYYYRFETNESVYFITVKLTLKLKNKSTVITCKSTVDCSPLNGIRCCYAYLRKIASCTELLERCMEGNAYDKKYSH